MGIEPPTPVVLRHCSPSGASKDNIHYTTRSSLRSPNTQPTNQGAGISPRARGRGVKIKQKFHFPHGLFLRLSRQKDYMSGAGARGERERLCLLTPAVPHTHTALTPFPSAKGPMMLLGGGAVTGTPQHRGRCSSSAPMLGRYRLRGGVGVALVVLFLVERSTSLHAAGCCPH